VHQVGFIYKIIQAYTFNKTLKKKMAGNIVEAISAWQDCADIMSERWRNVAKDNIRLQMCRMSIKLKEYEILERGFRDK